MNATDLKDALLDALVEAYEDAGLRGLCGDGRWEAAVGTVRSLDAELLAERVRAARAYDRNTASAGAAGPNVAGIDVADPGVADLNTGETRMAGNWKPADYNRVSPYLIVDGAARTIDFLVEAFAAERLRQYPAPDGKLMHAEVRIGDSVIMIADGNEGWPPIGAHVHVYVPDVDETYRRALAAGAESIQEPVKKDDEDRRGGVKDRGGTTWWIATRVE